MSVLIELSFASMVKVIKQNAAVKNILVEYYEAPAILKRNALGQLRLNLLTITTNPTGFIQAVSQEMRLSFPNLSDDLLFPAVERLVIRSVIARSQVHSSRLNSSAFFCEITQSFMSKLLLVNIGFGLVFLWRLNLHGYYGSTTEM